MATKEKDSNANADAKLVFVYLQHVYKSIQILKLGTSGAPGLGSSRINYELSNNKSTSNGFDEYQHHFQHQHQHTNVDKYIDSIARDLLFVCDPKVLSLPIPQHNFTYFDKQYNDVVARMKALMKKNVGSRDDEVDEGDEGDDRHGNQAQNKNDPPAATNKTYETRPKVLSARKDILRNIFYNMAPIAYDVSTHVAFIVAKKYTSTTTSTNIKTNNKTITGDSINNNNNMDLCLNSFILFSFWIEQAPQIAPIVTDLFRLSQFTCPFDHALSLLDHNNCKMDVDVYVDHDNEMVHMDVDDDESLHNTATNTTTYSTTNENIQKHIHIPIQELTIICEAVNRIVGYYTKIDEVSSLKSWWDWTKLYTLLGYQNENPSIDNEMTIPTRDNFLTYDPNDFEHDVSQSSSIPNYGYATPNTTYDHHIACKWFIGRAIANLLCLTGTSKGIYLDQLNVRYEFVPWMTHPWIILEEKEQFQNLALRKIMCFTFFECNDCNHDSHDSHDSDNDNENEEMVDHEGSTDVIMTMMENGKNYYPFVLNDVTVEAPTPMQIRNVVSLHPSLVHLGNGVIIPRRNPISSLILSSVHYDCQPQHQQQLSSVSQKNQTSRQNLIITPTTAQNLELLGTALSSDPYPPPVLVCGPKGSGKSSLIREIARLCSEETTAHQAKSISNNDSSGGGDNNNLLEIHVDEETDSKTLLGSYAATDIPGEFTWRPGALTTAVRKGKWILLEDVENCPIEIQAALVKLFEERILPLGVGKNEKCHPDFRMFGTCTTASLNDSAVGEGENEGQRKRRSVATAGSGGKRILHPGLWRKVHVEPLPYSELTMLSRELYPSLPTAVSAAVMKVFRMLDKSGRADLNSLVHYATENSNENENESPNVAGGRKVNVEQSVGEASIFGNSGRHASVRDLVKLLGRIYKTVTFEPGVTYCTESQRILCMAECFDIFIGWNPCRDERRVFATQILADAWGLSPTAVKTYTEDRQPPIKVARDLLEVGRCAICSPQRRIEHKGSNFADTNYALRLMEAAGISISLNEPTLLVGETGCGKTTLLQRLASLSGHELIIQNLSLQTDSTDLLGGYRPLEIKHIARIVYTEFVDLFISSFSKSQNAHFLDFVTAAYEKDQWKKLSQCFRRAAKMGLDKVKNRDNRNEQVERWMEFKLKGDRFEKQRVACDTGLAFSFTEGALVDAIRLGKWVLLDEINLASSETLQRLCGLLDDSMGSVTLTEKGDSEAIHRHPDFRLFAAMNPATDAGKKDLPSSLRARFTELYVDELLDKFELRVVAGQYLNGAISSDGPIQNSRSVINAVDVYLKCRKLAEKHLVDGAGQRPRYTLRTLCRSLSAAKRLIVIQKLGVQRAILEGFELGFEGTLDPSSRRELKKLLFENLGNEVNKKQLDLPGRRPGSRNEEDDYTLVKPFWLKTGSLEQKDYSKVSKSTHNRFVLTPSMLINLRRISRSIACGPWPILLEGPTSAGKTSIIEYLASRCGHKCVRINNHEHTDVQEYTGSYTSDENGKLCFSEGILVQALRRGYWVILDELNLAPSEVLEALNRLLDDNRELYLSEINEVVKPHENFRLFATQNPSGAYGGRKPLSRAFRNRFVEIHVGGIPDVEMVTILEQRCKCPPSYAKLLVKIMSVLRKRRSKSNVFRGQDGLITPRDLLRWAMRKFNSKEDLAIEGFMLLAERLRDDDEKVIVKQVIEEVLKVDIDCDKIYYGSDSHSRHLIAKVRSEEIPSSSGLTVESIAPTKSLLRLLTLVDRCVQQKEPVLLVGDTGCGKTTVVQLMSVLLRQKLQIVNCHANTETSDLLGGLRPLRGRQLILESLVEDMSELREKVKEIPLLNCIAFPAFLHLSENEVKPSFPLDAAQQIDRVVNKIQSALAKPTKPQNILEEAELIQCEKKRKLDHGGATKFSPKSFLQNEMSIIISRIKEKLEQYHSLFEWVDGPLVRAMKNGDMFLLDEMSLAEDAVLERLNSVLEPSRTLTLAEKGGDIHAKKNDGGSIINASDTFRIFATMNPGGDFGKRELSPALRSRFTEIWVPAVTDNEDIGLVLEQTLLSATTKNSNINHESLKVVREKMLDYVDWFNNDICANPSSTLADFSLSLRDILAWAKFIVDTRVPENGINLWAAYVHGASLMHLDGLGLGTGLAQNAADSTKFQAKQFIDNQVPEDCGDWNTFQNNNDSEFAHHSQGMNTFGIYPFFIRNGPNAERQSNGFQINAPTTALNLVRVLRAMQIKKPILLEGSPGVGKTSLIAALADMSGHSLVRINLSEQTDITDLMGSDLPVPDDGNENSGASFQWCDGALLRAIKNGDWVLLDELNLASQSVLEGLNSCLDHRACVYVPELGETFECPPSFRIFAAQNPLAQGGGRKGLPKSFLNRFTKVYVEALSEEDLRDIVVSKFPIIPSKTIEQMVKFNCLVQKDIDDKKFGQLGSPWEFNLRDVFRWCQLVSEHCKTNNQIDCGIFTEAIYIQRLRSNEDRKVLQELFHKCFGESPCFKRMLNFSVYRDCIQVGNASVSKNNNIVLNPTQMVQNAEEPLLFRTRLRSMESIMHCVNMNWPCLIVGQSSSGKSTLLKLVADLCNVKLEEVVLTPSSDVNELIGGFEQIDTAEIENRLLEGLAHIVNCAITTLVRTSAQISFLQNLNSLYYFFKKHTEGERHSRSIQNGRYADDILETAKKIINIAARATAESPTFSMLCKGSIQSARMDVTKLEENVEAKVSAVQFRWIDGVLVQALEKGYWLHLENVNLCSSSVLDRLNPLMEPDGVLVLTECGIKGEGNMKGKSRVVKPHPNFRLFLSTNFSHGEVSRAMRNRCIEISLLSPPLPQCYRLDAHQTKILSNMEAIDTLGVMQNAGIASSTLANYLVAFHIKESNVGDTFIHEEPRILKEWACLVSNLLNRGFTGDRLSRSGQHVAYGTKGDTESSFFLQAEDDEQMIRQQNVRSLLSSAPSESTVQSGAALVKAAGTLIKTLQCLTFFGMHQISEEKKHPLDRFAPSLKYGDKRWTQLKFELIGSYISYLKHDDFNNRWIFFQGYFEQIQKSIQYLTSKRRQMCMLQNDSKDIVLGSRFFAILSEFELYDRASQINHDLNDADLSIVELSYCIFQNQIDRSNTSCQIIPVLHPLFLAIDKIVCSIIRVSDTSEAVLKAIEKLLKSRDCLWMFLKMKKVDDMSDILPWFHEPRFLVHWNWLKKSLSMLTISFDFESTGMKNEQMNLELIIFNIDKALLINGGDGRSMSNKFWKRIGHPIVPAKASDWLNLYNLRKDDASCSILNFDHFDFVNRTAGDRKTLSLSELIEQKHPFLSTCFSLKLEILSAQCMVHWTSTDETSSTIRIEKKDYDIFNITRLVQSKIHSAKDSLMNKLHLHAVDATVHMDSNKLDVADLESLQEQCQENFDDDGMHIIEKILSTFGGLQIMPLVEYWCVREEVWIIEAITRFINCGNDGVVNDLRSEVLPRIKKYIRIVLNSTIWPVYDLRPFQTFLWALESQSASKSDFHHLFRCLYSNLLMNSSKHHWYNSFNDLSCISDKLIAPSFWNFSVRINDTAELPPKSYGYDMGAARLKHDVITSCLFRMLGYNSDSLYSSKFPYLTLENHKARESQARHCVNFLCSDLRVLEAKASSYDICIFFIKSIMEVSRDFFPVETDHSSLRFYILGQSKMEDAEVNRIIESCTNEKFKYLTSHILKPLASIMAYQSQKELDASVALASVYVGLFSFHLLVPSSSLDPGTKPAAKAKELGVYLQILSSRLVSLRSQCGLSHGNFYPDSFNVATLLEECTQVHGRKCRQDKKRVERPQDAPEFHQFVREILHFSDTIMSCDNIIRLIDAIEQQSNREELNLSDMEINWQSSSLSFAQKISTTYSCYEDVTSPFLAALGMVQNGMRSYCYHKLMRTYKSDSALLTAQAYLLQYPNTCIHHGMSTATISAISEAFDIGTKKDSNLHYDSYQMEKLGKRSKFSFLLASISHLVLLRTANCVDQSFWSKISSCLFHSIAMAWELAAEQSSTSDSDANRDETEEERNERQFREQFPDHRREFSKLVEVTEAAAAGEDLDEQLAESNDDNLFVEKIHISDQESNLLAELHYTLYSNNAEVNDAYRTRTFHLMYSAGALLNHKISRQVCSQTEINKFNAHCLAIALNCTTKVNLGVHNLNNQTEFPDFHRDSNPKEVLKAYKPLQNLLHRVTQLLRAFPGNAILIAIGQVSEMMLQLDLNKVPLGKMLTGLEVVLRKAQDWEQHASQRVTLGDRLRQVSRLVASWRKLELQSWSNLLNVRERQYIVNCRRHWMRLYLLLIQPLENKSNSDRSSVPFEKIPNWIWKGVASKMKYSAHETKAKLEDKDMIEVIKALDSFILTAGIGHFNERLRMINGFANQLGEESRQSFDIQAEIKSRILKSFCEHYSKFVPLVDATKDNLRKPIETKLKNEVKLAKWDEQSYYSLSESSEKSHMKLMMIVREYDEVLQTGVGKILEDNFLSGIRSNSEVLKSGAMIEPTTNIPSNGSLFPLLKLIQDTVDTNIKNVVIHEHLRSYGTKREYLNVNFSKYILNINKYIAKMNKIFPQDDISSERTYAFENYETVNIISDAIFERIELLREKGTKPMKQRALVDLFKLLKKQGFSSMKWSVPNEVRDMNAILQLPTFDPSKLSPQYRRLLHESEDYFRRNTIELSRLRSEVSMIGSSYMSKREMELMTGFGDHGLLLLCQQRSVLSHVICELEDLRELLSGFNSIHDKLPGNQLLLSTMKSKLNVNYFSLLEIFQQTYLAMKTIASFNSEEGESYRDIIGTFAGCLNLLKDSYKPNYERDGKFVTESHITEIMLLRKQLSSIQENLEKCREMSTASLCLPTNFFKQCIDQTKQCLERAEMFEELLSETKTTHFEASKVSEFDSLISEIVKSALLAAQNLNNGTTRDHKQDEETSDDDIKNHNTIWENHYKMLCEWDSVQLHKLNKFLCGLKEFLMENSNHIHSDEFHHYSINASSLVLKVMDICQIRLVANLKFLRSIAKFEYVKLRIFRALVSKGYCADEVEDSGDGEGDAGNMNFDDDVEGTGMGEGDGKNDVTDEIENEEQLLGLKGDEKEEKPKDQKELGEEEAETGMEMENEFDGELFDVPEKQEEEKERDDDNEEELDREMGDISDPNEQVVDEKMWDEDDDEEGQQEEEKFEKDSKMTGESVQDEMRTKEEDEGDDKGKEGEDKSQGDIDDKKEDNSSPQEECDNGGKGDDEEEIINDDLEDNYEDQHVGFDVRNEDDNDETKDDDDDIMDLDDDMNLDEGDDVANDDDKEDNEIDEGNQESEDNAETTEAGEVDNEKDGNSSDENETDAEGIQNSHKSLDEDNQPKEENGNENEDQEEEEDNAENDDLTKTNDQQYPEAQGVAASSGADKIKEVEENVNENGEEDDGGEDDNEDRNGIGEKEDINESNPGAGGQSNDTSGDFQNGHESSKSENKSDTAMDAPNPFRDPGDAEKFWHRKLDMIQDMDVEQENEDANTKTENNEEKNSIEENKDTQGTFEFTSNDQKNTTQVLGGVEDEEVAKLEESNKEDNVSNKDIDEAVDDEEIKPPVDNGRKNPEPNKSKSNLDNDAKKSKSPETYQKDEEKFDMDEANVDMNEVSGDNIDEDDDANDEELDQENRVMTDLAQLQVDEHNEGKVRKDTLIEVENHGGISLEEAEEARKKWSQLSAETNSLSRRLCEKLRLVMEPLVASKLRGDYRTGKRINMKRVIGYIASGYRKDKIWLRRTKPGKRDYRVLLAVDNSESMRSGAGEVALMALATLATGMSQLEVGELGVASFGDEMKLLHPFNVPFTSSSGADVVSNFKFDDKRTRTALCVESAMAALESDNGSSSMQLVFMISDGRIERDSREDLRRLVREMTERSILLVMIIVEGDKNGVMKLKDSIVNMKEVSFQNGKPKVKHFIDDYPFPYYMILQDMNSLPEVLGDALKQWFEMMVQNKS